MRNSFDWSGSERVPCGEYCQISQQFDDTPFEIDHIVSDKHEGPTSAGNLALSCFYCNSYKGSDIAARDKLTCEPRRSSTCDGTGGRGTSAGKAAFSSVLHRSAASPSRSSR